MRDSTSILGAGGASACLSRGRRDLVADALRAGQATLLLPERKGALEHLTRLVEPARMLEHGDQVLVRPTRKPRRIGLGLRGCHGCSCKRQRLLEVAGFCKQETQGIRLALTDTLAKASHNGRERGRPGSSDVA